MSDDVISLASGTSTAEVAITGAEPLSWRVAGRELLWHGDPAHWGFRAPNLFPVVGASKGEAIRVDGVAYPMPQHGFARRLRFALVESAPDSVHMRLTDTPETRAHYPFRFALDVVATLAPSVLTLAFAVKNTGERAMPYGLGCHPAFPWPFDADDRRGHRVRFAEAERADVPEVAAGGLLARQTRPVPLVGRDLPLSPDLFKEALVFLDARSRSLRFNSPTGAAIELAGEGFPHLAVWTKPTAPFLSLEAWSAHAEWEEGEGDLAQRASMTTLGPGEVGRHRLALSWHPA